MVDKMTKYLQCTVKDCNQDNKMTLDELKNHIALFHKGKFHTLRCPVEECTNVYASFHRYLHHLKKSHNKTTIAPQTVSIKNNTLQKYEEIDDLVYQSINQYIENKVERKVQNFMNRMFDSDNTSIDKENDNNEIIITKEDRKRKNIKNIEPFSKRSNFEIEATIEKRNDLEDGELSSPKEEALYSPSSPQVMRKSSMQVSIPSSPQTKYFPSSPRKHAKSLPNSYIPYSPKKYTPSSPKTYVPSSPIKYTPSSPRIIKTQEDSRITAFLPSHFSKTIEKFRNSAYRRVYSETHVCEYKHCCDPLVQSHCVFCNGAHLDMHCYSVSSPKDRFKLYKAKGVCFRCGKYSHPGECPMRSCVFCPKKDHSSAICCSERSVKFIETMRIKIQTSPLPYSKESEILRNKRSQLIKEAKSSSFSLIIDNISPGGY